MTFSRRATFAAIALPLSLTLAACGGSGDEIEEADPITAIAPPEGQAWTDVVEISEYDGYILGNPDAPIKVVEYASLTCPACAGFAQNGAEQLKANYVSTGVVSFELRNLTLNAFDMTLARLVRCSAPESYHPLSQQVWMNFDTVMGGAQAASDTLAAAGDIPDEMLYVAIGDAAGFLDFFAQRGISRDQATACLSDAESVIAIDTAADAQGAEFGVTGTPTFFVNGVKVDGITWADVEPVLQRAGARTAE